MPSARSSQAKALSFLAREDELVTEFLCEYEDLANSCRLSPVQEVETVLHYVPRILQRLWKTLPSYQAKDWDNFKLELERLHPDVRALSRDTKQGLETFRKLSAKSCMRDEDDVLRYYRNFLTVVTPLLLKHHITMDNFNTAFFKGFPRSIRDIIAERFEKVYPHHPVHEPFHMQGILDAAH